MDASVHPVRAFRLRQNPPLAQEVLARRIGITKPNLSRIETGQQRISENLLPRICAETGIPAATLRPDLAKLFNAAPSRRRRARAA
ncbi:MAG: helix-turn-helix transcriptional regulator [Gammaproteobacteria bacterium]|nr:helix-turn-helix transcriptional regulator [Gammaproteobacteria bacterium]